MKVSRRSFFAAGAGAFSARHLTADPETPKPPAWEVPAYDKPATVSLVKGDQRRKNAHDALLAIDAQIRPVLKRKKYVVIKPNNVSVVNQLAATHVDALHGILDYLAPRFKGSVVIAEAAAADTKTGYDNFKYADLIKEHKRLQVSLVDLNEEAKYEVLPVLDENMHPTPVRLAARLLDPDAFILCSAILKTHNTVVATLSIKNMTLGAPLHQAPKETPRWNDKRKYHGGVRQTHYDMMLTAQKMQPFWGATLIDGYEGMEGNGPASGTPVPSRVALASTDYVAADRIALEVMGINADFPGYLQYCWRAGLGQYDLNRIKVEGEKIADVKKTYRLHRDIERQLQWLGPMNEIPVKLG